MQFERYGVLAFPILTAPTFSRKKPRSHDHITWKFLYPWLQINWSFFKNSFIAFKRTDALSKSDCSKLPENFTANQLEFRLGFSWEFKSIFWFIAQINKHLLALKDQHRSWIESKSLFPPWTARSWKMLYTHHSWP